MARELERRRSRAIQDVTEKTIKPRGFSSGLYCCLLYRVRRLVALRGGAVVCTPGIVGSLNVNI